METRALVIGIGQPWRGDDAAGLTALEGLATACPQADVVAHGGEGLGLIGLWDGRGLVVVIDAAADGRPPGSLGRYADALPPEVAARSSSHAFGLQQAVGVAAALGRMPGRLVVHTVSGGCWTLGAPLSPAVADALPALRAAVLVDLAHEPMPPQT